MSERIRSGKSMESISHVKDDDTTSTNSSEEHKKEEFSLYKHHKQNDFKVKKAKLIWPMGRAHPAMLIFSSEVVLKNHNEFRKLGEQFYLSFKFLGGERKLIRTILDGHGFKEVHPNSSEFNVLWTGNNLKTYTFRSLKEFQKVNHFPRSCELTRKDRLYKNVQRMQQEKGIKTFQILPITFIMPFEIDDFYSTFYREKGVWIVKPCALSRGRGIYLVNHPDQVPLDENLVVSKYITNPLLIEGYKFDLRLYVAVTSFDPLVVYLYEEGLTRFATMKYDKSLKNTKNIWMHLTNYSVNKKNDKYVRCDDPDVEDYGNKWSLSALLRYLAREGKDTFGMMMQIEETIIKALLAVESPLASAARMFVPHRGNCFEVFGFDILIDEDLRPWVLEVNLSPSLDCEAILDLKIKSNMIADLFSLTGIYCQNPKVYSNRNRFVNRSQADTQQQPRSRPQSAHFISPSLDNQKQSGASRPATTKVGRTSSARQNVDLNFEGLSANEASIFKTVQDESTRRGGWTRIFPTSDTWEFFSNYLEQRSTSYNLMLHQKLFPKRWMHGNTKKTSVSRAKLLQSTFILFKSTSNDSLLHSSDSGIALDEAVQRYKSYERKSCENFCRQALEGIIDKFVDIDQNPTSDPKTPSHVLDGSKKILDHVSLSSAINTQVSYDLDTILNYLDDGRHMSRVQVRHAFELYLSKIQVRLNIESELRDDSNMQQMDLVFRFMKKASTNLSHTFRPYMPSRQLPVCEQKRMLAKQLLDFLHIYKKDTDTIRHELDVHEKQKLKQKSVLVFDDQALNNFLHKCNELGLEEIMSSYMKNSKDSSAFLGTFTGIRAKSPQNKKKPSKVSKPSASRSKPKTSYSDENLSVSSESIQSMTSFTSSDVNRNQILNKKDEIPIEPHPPQLLKRNNFKSKADEIAKTYMKKSMSNISISSNTSKQQQQLQQPPLPTQNEFTTSIKELTKNLNQKHNRFDKPKSASFKKLSYTNERENDLGKRINSAIYVQKHVKNNSNDSNESRDGKHKDWSAQLKSLASKQQERQYQTSIVPSLQALVHLNQDQQINMSKIEIDEDILARQSTLIEKQKDLLEKSKKMLEMSKTNSVFSSINTMGTQINELKYLNNKIPFERLPSTATTIN